MNEKNSLGLDKCFGELDNPILLFTEWYNEAKKTEINEINGILHLMGQKQNVKTTLNLEYLKKINALINS